MSSAHILLLALVAALHILVQADTTETTTKPEVVKSKTDIETESSDIAGSSPDVTKMIEEYVKQLDNFFNSNTRVARRKRWADYQKRPGYYNSYNSYAPSSSYTRYRYPSNLMALLRGTKRGWSDKPMTRWQYPSNLMVLLRGKKSVEDEPVEDDDEEEVEEEEEEEMSPLQHEALMDIMTRLAAGWQRFINNYNSEMSAKRSAFYGYGDEGRGSISRGPFGARQFMVWNGGRYILG